MIRSNESAMQRLQVGLVGLLSVLVFVSIASMILHRADGTGQAANAKSSGDDPLVELGVTPVVPEQQGKQAPAGPATQKPRN
jgi:hypothetical protein